MISFNTNGAKRNLNFIEDLLIYDIVYICETWLMDFECKTLLNNLSSDFISIHHSDMLISPSKGRPFGGRVFMINKLLKIIKSEFINKHVSYLLFAAYDRKFCNIYTYLPYDENSQLTLSEFISCLQIIGELFIFFESKEFSRSGF